MNLEGDLKGFIYGQDAAIAELASTIKLARSGLRSPEKPIGNSSPEEVTGLITGAIQHA